MDNLDEVKKYIGISAEDIIAKFTEQSSKAAYFFLSGATVFRIDPVLYWAAKEGKLSELRFTTLSYTMDGNVYIHLMVPISYIGTDGNEYSISRI